MSQTSFSIISLAVRFHLTIKRRVGGARVGGARVEGDNSQRRELQAHASTSALVLCSSISVLGNFDGLYNGPSSDPQSKLINTYVKERHQGQIAFGDKSRLGRRGMTAKVKAGVYAAYAGVPVIIASGKTADGIINVLEGQRIGTLFHKDAHSWDPIKETGARFLERALGGFRRGKKFF